jgi:uncharacterized membrane protein YfcA
VNYDLSSAGWGVLGLAAFVVGFSKTGMPGLGIMAIPLTALVLPAKASTGIVLPMLIAGDLFAVTIYRRQANWGLLAQLSPWAVIGIVIGYKLLSLVTDQQLRPLIGVLILTMIAVSLWRERYLTGDEESRPHHWCFAVAMGLAAGIATMMANAAGPVMALYLLAMGLPKDEFVGTGAWFFFIINCVKVPFSGALGLINPDSLLLNLRLLPATLAGALLGMFVLKMIPQFLFARIVRVLVIVAAIMLLF